MSDEYDLLRELARLRKRYGDAAFDRAIALLADSRGLELFLSALSAARKPAVHRETRSLRKERETGSRALGDEVLTIGEAVPERREAIEALWAELSAGRVLRRLRDIKEFAGKLGLVELQTRRRDQAALELLRAVAGLPSPRFEEVMRELMSLNRKQTAGLREWSDIILKKPWGGGDASKEARN